MDRRGQIPIEWIAWIESTLADARREVERVPLRLDDHRQWLNVFRAIAFAQSRCKDIRRLSSWLDMGSVQADTASHELQMLP